jgi:uncharacterized protein YyaL (SSP411 family)
VPNRLAAAKSPYLLQHADQPVDWWPWGDEAIAEARRLDRPIFLSVGYAACHWCHVMAHESFDDVDVAGILNEHFIPIKVDREERPDIDALYMTATQLISGHGGWPMSVFLTPDLDAFYAGTYFAPTDQGRRPGFTTVLRSLAHQWQHDRELVNEQATNVAAGVLDEVRFIDRLALDENPNLNIATETLLASLRERISATGGFGGAPKFPRTSLVRALFLSKEEWATDHARTTLDAWIRSGLYDHVDGGFARYCVDDEWVVPHFEKMLYDQALISLTLFEAAAVLDAPIYREVARTTLNFVLRAFATPQGYASAFDADADGHEGSHVTWTPSEIAGLCPEDADALCRRYTIHPTGDLDGRSIPRLAPGEPWITPDALQPALASLRRARMDRPQPAIDHKVILEWNAMFACALMASSETTHLDEASRLLASLWSTHFDGAHWWRTADHSGLATQADLAWLLDATVRLFEVSGDESALRRATTLAWYLVEHFGDGPSMPIDAWRGLFAQSQDVSDLPVRTKDTFDNVAPSGHAMSIRALARLGLATGDQEWTARAQRLVYLLGTLTTKHPTDVVDSVLASYFALEGIQIVMPGAVSSGLKDLRWNPMRRGVLISGEFKHPLFNEREMHRAYVCANNTCSLPFSDPVDLGHELNRLGA